VPRSRQGVIEQQEYPSRAWSAASRGTTLPKRLPLWVRSAQERKKGRKEEASCHLFITQGPLTREYINGGLAKPEDRHAAISRLCEQVGGKLVSLYFTLGQYDFIVLSEMPDAKAVSMLAFVAAGGGGIEGSVRPKPSLQPRRERCSPRQARSPAAISQWARRSERGPAVVALCRFHLGDPPASPFSRSLSDDGCCRHTLALWGVSAELSRKQTSVLLERHLGLG
jgi:uncharacterized protein with GYD domain